MIWVDLFVLAALTWFATLNIALRIPSRGRLVIQFKKLGRDDDFEPFVVLRPQYLLATATLRSIVTLALFGCVLYHVHGLTQQSLRRRAYGLRRRAGTRTGVRRSDSDRLGEVRR